MAGAQPSNNLYFQNLPGDMDQETMSQIFAAVGYTVVQAKVMPNKTPRVNTCMALVRFQSVDEAQAVLNSFNGVALPGFDMPLSISFAAKPGVAAQPAALPFGSYGKSPVQSMHGQHGASPYGTAAEKMMGGLHSDSQYGNATENMMGGLQSFSQPYGNAAEKMMGGLQGASQLYGNAAGNKMGGLQGASQPYGNTVKKPTSSDNLYVKGLPATSDESFVKQLFGQYGTVRTCKVLRRNPGDPCHSLVRFSSVEEAMMVKNQLDGGMLDGFDTPLEIGFAIEKTLANLGGPQRGMPSHDGYGVGGTGDPETERMLDEWVKAKRTRDFQTADNLRAVLRAQGVDPDTARR